MKSRYWPAGLMFLLLLAPLLIWADVQSFWIDEAEAWAFSRSRSAGGMFTEVMASGGAAPQQPGYFLYIWFWARLGGFSEHWSRWSNLPWLLVLGGIWLQWARWLFPSNIARRLVFLVLLPVSPFIVWYSLEYRPYAMLLALSALAAHGFILVFLGERRGRWLAVAAGTIAFWTHMFGALLILSLALAILWSAHRRRLRLRNWLVPAVITAVGCIPAAVFYAYTLATGSSGPLLGASWKNAAFIFYEFLGFNGLGPSRDQFHYDQSLGVLLPWLPHLLLLAVPWIWLTVSGLRRFASGRPADDQVRRPSMAVIILASASVTSLLLLWLTALPVDFRILGRHVAFAFPAFLAGLGLNMLARGSLSKIDWAMVVALLLALGWSSMRLIHDPRYARDDYRGAVAMIARNVEPGSRIIFVGNMSGFRYYAQDRWTVTTSGATHPTPGVRPTAVVLDNPAPGDVRAAASGADHGIVLAITKPYVFDRARAVRGWLKTQSRAQLLGAPPTFEIWFLEPEP